MIPDASLPTATYRIQLRQGMTFADVEGHLPYLADLGVSHVYLSPIFRAVPGSTHGYDVIDPNEVEAELGGRDGFVRFAAAAKAANLGVILDIVPNHTAFVADNPWLRDVLRYGRRSRYARHFDIDWSLGPLALPWLEGPFEEVLEAGKLSIRDDAMLYNGMALPLIYDTSPDTDDAEAIRAAHDAQDWRLVHWVMERDAITHRRFFNVTGLIGMRIEDPKVFDDMHRAVFELVDADHVQGLRLDHVDGLADPDAYLERLAARLPGTPIWVEKILTGDEPLADWPVLGTTGYEAGRMIAQALTDGDGLARLDTLWRERTGFEGDFEATLEQAKGEVIRRDLSAELLALVRLAGDAAAAARVEYGDETLREAVIALLIAFPRYRTYGAPGDPWMDDADRALMGRVADHAGAEQRSDDAVRWLATVITGEAADIEGDGTAMHRFAVRFQQTTGALLAKAHEDTAGFRYNRLIAANEVGGDPDHAVLDAAGFDAALRQRLDRQPHGLTLTSSHDTKRSGDARARLIAVSHLPEVFAALFDSTPPSEDVDANLRWYIVQSAVAIQAPGDDHLSDRLVAHVTKAMREAKVDTNWTRPHEAAEAAATEWARALTSAWGASLPPEVASLTALGDRIALWQRALALTIPGIPDIYQGTEGMASALTDPDNRRAVDWDGLAALPNGAGKSSAKNRLTRALLQARRDHPALFAVGDVSFSGEGGSMTLTRSGGGVRITVTCGTEQAGGGRRLWPVQDADAGNGLWIDLMAKGDAARTPT